ncbi:CPBP family intramembrane metalloprotease [Staphylococcus coagulans]|uniref:CPBP family intramembrane glutamic endopeptidase n=1 Tax=Staphylococcus coagulans TaxID=74706 RepID=UPI000CD09185|nr:type II CAAX endopeptidase family protein [Staphylococcus coagulans]PNZ12932.1 CPBP family intramembrane metalloprotease [Staphylococcus coagulans]
MRASSNHPVAWRDLWAFVIYFLVQVILAKLFSLLLVPLHNFPVSLLFLIIGIITALTVIGYLIWSHRHHWKEKIIHAIKASRKYIGTMIGAYFLYIFANGLMTYLFKFLPEQWQFKETGNQESLMLFFNDPKWLPLAFLSIVILSPITEELLFRHVLIGELGKKVGYVITGIISTVVFALLHMQAAQSPFEIFPYLFLGLMFTYTYIKSGCNIAISIMMHMFNNFMAFIIMVIQLHA